MKITFKKFIITIFGIAIVKILYNSMLANGIVEFNDIYVNVLALENTYYLSQIMASVFVMMGTMIALWQYVLSSKDSIENRKREYQLHEKEIFEMEKDRIQKAIDLSGYYKDYILEDVMLIKSVYGTIGIQDILNKINFHNISHFDIYEMEKNITSVDREIIKKAALDEKMADALVATSEVVKIWEDCKDVTITEEDGKKVRQLTVSKDAILYQFQMVLNRILNNLEFFAMHFTHETADDSVVYQSLHQTYIETVQLLYYDISANNVPGESKLYTNVIELYNKWTKMAEEQKACETAAARENISKGKSLKPLDKR